MRLPARPRRRQFTEATTMKTMQARYSGNCPLCAGAIVPGQSINYGDGRRARHSACEAKLISGARAEVEALAGEAVEAPACPGGVDADHPCLRRYHRCPICNGHKDAGLLVCWPCYRKHDFRNNADACGNQIDDAEEFLAGNTYGRPWNERNHPARHIRRRAWRS